MISIKQLKYFVEIVAAGSYTRASERLYIAQSALSRQIKELENDIDVVLLRRDAKQVELTLAGRDFYDRARKILDDMDQAIVQARHIDKGERGAIRLLHSSSVPLSPPLGPCLNAVLQAFPGVTLEISQASSEHQALDVEEGRADLGLARTPILRKHPHLETITLYQEKLVVAVSLQHPLAQREVIDIAELRDELFVSMPHRERGGLSYLVAERCIAHGFFPRPARATSRKASLLSLVNANFGIAVVPDSMRAIAVAGVHFIDIREPDFQSAVVLMMRRDAPVMVGQFVQAFVQGLQMPAA
ncbi:LysR family transcriptional regulator [Herbaspirillum hiltneri N3]|uniref:LysR family transcriptional regulator n=1 Tax=Herbaspirillum hiltneri N3 TaxID=1262470 RepID=A0ABN4HYE2_9BURK|nr:LysR family transcriptional regulator [Herbaspirillum hiltneri]AKZ61651.1 LysR family transcriptional regulator [Herbaspirillum hiltneri N3]